LIVTNLTIGLYILSDAFDLPEIFHLSENDFADAAWLTFRHQHAHNELYRRFCNLVRPAGINEFSEIPFLPISFFKTAQVTTTAFIPQLVFESSGTSGQQTSSHFVKDRSLYDETAKLGFERLYGSLSGWRILGLLPSYLERGQSSLVHMADSFMQISKHPGNGFFLYDHESLASQIRESEATWQKTLLIGVTYALLDFAEAFPMPLQHTIVMETGGMKGRRREWLRSEVHDALKQAFQLQHIHSEYGMTELLSQAYALENGIFQTPPWMRVLAADEDDPFSMSMEPGRSGRLCVIDLANRWSCSFIATDDRVRMHPGGRFEVLGRLDHSDVRGCSLLSPGPAPFPMLGQGEGT
jgi:hypothetical protein